MIAFLFVGKVLFNHKGLKVIHKGIFFEALVFYFEPFVFRIKHNTQSFPPCNS